MNIVMMTNTYKPIIGGLERSIELLSAKLRERGNKVLIVTPEVDRGRRGHEEHVYRLPAITHVRKTEFPVQLPVPTELASVLTAFSPDVIHSHHPFLVGDTALRVSARFGVPLVFTMHTLYEKYTHYLPLDSAALKRFMAHLATGYANLCDHVLAPSPSVARLLSARGVTAPVTVVPTGIPVAGFSAGNGAYFRQRKRIPADAFVVGFVGRIAREKNMGFLAEAVARFMRLRPDAYFLVVGSGPMSRAVEAFFERRRQRHRLRLVGALAGQALVNAYHAMDVFAFASLTETQGLVLAEAMASGVPVVAVDAPGVRDILEQGVNGTLCPQQDTDRFVGALVWTAGLPAEGKRALKEACLRTAARFSDDTTAGMVSGVYAGLVVACAAGRGRRSGLDQASHLIKAEWLLLLNIASAAGHAMLDGGMNASTAGKSDV